MSSSAVEAFPPPPAAWDHIQLLGIFRQCLQVLQERGDVIRFNQRPLRADAAAFSTSAVASISYESE